MQHIQVLLGLQRLFPGILHYVKKSEDMRCQYLFKSLKDSTHTVKQSMGKSKH